MRHEELTIELLKSVLTYDEATGLFRYRIKRGRHRAGDLAGGLSSDGYWRIRINRQEYRAHRLAWFYVYGNWPLGEVDHKFGVRTDNRIDQLRDTSPSENRQNLRAPTSRNTSGYLGVSWNKMFEKFEARIRVGGKGLYLGRFDDPREAHSAYLAAKRKHHSACVI